MSVRLGPVVSGGGVELEELEVLDVLDDEPGGRVVVVEDRVVAVVAVSYTHLDVYKRQASETPDSARSCGSHNAHWGS